MQAYWYLYPHSVVVTLDHINALPWAPYSWAEDHLLWQSPVWDADLQTYVYGWLAEWISRKPIFDGVFNTHLDTCIELHNVSGCLSLDNIQLRELIGWYGCTIKICNP